MQKKNWNELDIILVTGDAYVDHPAFGTAVIGRVLESKGYKVGIISMPDWTNPESVKILGKPKLFFGVTSGNVESMIAKYTAFKKPRSDDPYAPGGKSGHRPNRALIVYCNLIKQAFNDVPIVIGGLEASMRRVAHYDYWSNKVRRNILADTRADILVYGMGEMQIATIAERLKNQEPLTAIPGTVVFSKDLNSLKNTYLDLPSEQQVIESKETFLEFYRKFFRHQQKTLVQKSGTRYLVHNSPPAITTNELDNIYDLPFQRKPHPSYEKPVPAFDMIKNSITAHRGCVSGCSFCSLSLHQGKRIISRSESSVLKEVSKISQAGYFKGHITDIGGPSANMYGFQCKINWQCPRESCTFPNLCKNLMLDNNGWLTLLEKVKNQKGISKVTVGSGIRFDLFFKSQNAKANFKKLVKSFISGQLKIAPEHTNPNVLTAMRKTPLIELEQFIQNFNDTTNRMGKKQYPLPYLMSNHPGSTIHDMVEMKNKIFKLFHTIPEQVQSFIPLPMTLSSVIYYTGTDPLTNKKYYVERDINKKRKQHNVFFMKNEHPKESKKHIRKAVPRRKK